MTVCNEPVSLSLAWTTSNQEEVYPTAVPPPHRCAEGGCEGLRPRDGLILADRGLPHGGTGAARVTDTDHGIVFPS